MADPVPGQKAALGCSVFGFFSLILMSFQTSGKALIPVCPSPQLRKLRKQKCFLDKAPHNYRP